jgi:hypothetical protein
LNNVGNNNQKIISKVKENMAKPHALNYRGNTGNTGYGFV